LPELHKQALLQVGNKSKEVYLIVVTGAKTDLDNFNLEKYHQQTRDRMLQKMKNASVTQPISLTIDGHPAVQDELTRTEKGANVVFFTTQWTTAIISTNPRVDTEIAVAKPRTLSGLRKVTASFRNEK
jgi:phosphodiesterase/alkaline phosphatase D-like protein